MSDYQLADGEELHSASPRSFFIPSRAERDALQPGDYAKLLFEVVDPQPGDPHAERMWVQIVEVNEGHFAGALSNTPRVITTIVPGGRVVFGPEHVIGTIEDWPLLEKKMFVSLRSDEHDVRPGYLYREDPDNELDSGWRALVGDETDEENDDPSNILLQDVGYLLDRWPELRPVFETDPQNAEWVWDSEGDEYILAPWDD